MWHMEVRMKASLRLQLGDERLNIRGENCIEKLMKYPSGTFPEVFVDAAELEGFYRFLHNSRTSSENILLSVIEQSFERAHHEPEILAIHDTTEIKIKSKKIQEFEKLSGFWAHVSLLVKLGEPIEVLGPIGLRLMTKAKGQKSRWLESIHETEKMAKNKTSLIHVMDSETDACSIWSKLQCKERFVLRAHHNRKAKTLDGGSSLLFNEIEKAPVMGERTIWVSKRRASPMPAAKLRHASRENKEINVKIAAKMIEVHLSNPKSGHYTSKTTTMNVVRVFEKPKATTGRDQVDWILFTSEPIATPEEVFKVVDIYRQRWVIEEFFKALKTGCQIERRLLADAEAWFNLTAMLLPVATTVLNLRMNLNLRLNKTKNIFTKTQLKILKIKAKKYGYELKTYFDAQAVIAKMGGHIRWNGPPGWITLLKGFIELRALEAGWLLAEGDEM